MRPTGRRTGPSRTYRSIITQRAVVFFGPLLGFTAEGAKIVFGNLIHSEGVPVLVKTADGHTLNGMADTGAYFAFFVLPTILFFSTLTAIAWHTGVMQYVVQGLAWIMSKSMRTSFAAPREAR